MQEASVEIDEVREYCLQLPEVTEGFPFGEGVLVFKVAGKMFLASNLDAYPASCNLKCEPSRAVELREEYDGIKPGWHMNKKHWNTILLDGTVPSTLIEEMLDHSYELVVGSLKKADRERIRATLAATRADAP